MQEPSSVVSPAPWKVLLVDDERQILRGLQLNLRARGFDTELAATGTEALLVAPRVRPDAVLLDLGLPDMDGVDVIVGLRAWTAVPIIVLSARVDEGDKVAALDAGADDYVTKPFGIEELLARLRVVLRRSRSSPELPIVITDDFTVDLVNKQVKLASGEQVRLTPIEWALLDHLVRHSGRLVTQRDLLHAVWGPGYEHETNYLRVHLTHLRQKLEPVAGQPRYFITEPGIGYRFVQTVT
jgi:two-component system, OmpR family, KDP operon response regulator KdpE